MRLFPGVEALERSFEIAFGVNQEVRGDDDLVVLGDPFLDLHQASIVGQQFAGRVGLFLRVDDFEAAYERMVTAGVRFVSPPRNEPYGTLTEACRLSTCAMSSATPAQYSWRYTSPTTATVLPGARLSRHGPRGGAGRPRPYVPARIVDG